MSNVEYEFEGRKHCRYGHSWSGDATECPDCEYGLPPEPLGRIVDLLAQVYGLFEDKDWDWFVREFDGYSLSNIQTMEQFVHAALKASGFPGDWDFGEPGEGSEDEEYEPGF